MTKLSWQHYPNRVILTLDTGKKTVETLEVYCGIHELTPEERSIAVGQLIRAMFEQKFPKSLRTIDEYEMISVKGSPWTRIKADDNTLFDYMEEHCK